MPWWNPLQKWAFSIPFSPPREPRTELTERGTRKQGGNKTNIYIICKRLRAYPVLQPLITNILLSLAKSHPAQTSPLLIWNTTKQPQPLQQHQKPETTLTQANQAQMAASVSPAPSWTLLPSPSPSHSHTQAARRRTASSKHP